MKPTYVKSPSHTPIEEIRQTLASLEIRIARMADETPQSAFEILEMLDHVAAKMERAEEFGSKLTSEKSQWETVLAQFRGKAPIFLRIIGGASQLSTARQNQSPPVEYWWWQIDEQLAKQKKGRLRKMGISTLITLIVLALAIFTYQKFFAPDPETVASYQAEQSAESYLQAGQYEQGLAAIEQGLSHQPENPAFLVLRGVLHQALENPSAAEGDFTAAQDIYEQDDMFYSQRASYYLMMSQVESALADAVKARESNPDNAYAFLLEGQANQMLGAINDAIQAFQMADEVAGRTDNPEIQVFARMLLAEVIQSPQLLPAPTETQVEE